MCEPDQLLELGRDQVLDHLGAEDALQRAVVDLGEEVDAVVDHRGEALLLAYRHHVGVEVDADDVVALLEPSGSASRRVRTRCRRKRPGSETGGKRVR